MDYENILKNYESEIVMVILSESLIPIWIPMTVITVCGIALFVTLYFMFLNEKRYSYALIVEAALIVGAIGILANPTKSVHENPVNVEHESSINGDYVEIDETLLNKRIADAIQADNVSVESRSNQQLFSDLHKQRLVDFSGIKDSKEITGKVFFNESEMMVVVKGSNKTVKVSAK